MSGKVARHDLSQVGFPVQTGLLDERLVRAPGNDTTPLHDQDQVMRTGRHSQQLDDVRVTEFTQPAEDSNLAANHDPRASSAVQELECDGLTEGEIVGAKYFAHAAIAAHRRGLALGAMTYLEKSVTKENLTAAFDPCRIAIPHMKAQKAGSIINRASLDLDLLQVNVKSPNDFVFAESAQSRRSTERACDPFWDEYHNFTAVDEAGRWFSSWSGLATATQ